MTHAPFSAGPLVTIGPAGCPMTVSPAPTGATAARRSAGMENLALGVNEMSWLRFPGPVVGLCLVDPSIAEAMTVDGHAAILLGRRPGTTLLIALGNDGRPMARWRISVGGQTRPHCARAVSIPLTSTADETARVPTPLAA